MESESCQEDAVGMEEDDLSEEEVNRALFARKQPAAR